MRLRYGFTDGQTLRYEVVGGIESIVTDADGRQDNISTTFSGTATIGASDSLDPFAKEVHVGQRIDATISADVFGDDAFGTRITDTETPLLVRRRDRGVAG